MQVLTPAVFVLAGLRWGASAVLVPFLSWRPCWSSWMIDLEHFRIPTGSSPGAGHVGGLDLIIFVSLIEGFDVVFVRNAFIGSIAYFTLLLVPHLIYPRGIGFGDVKLALLMGLFLGLDLPDPSRSWGWSCGPWCSGSGLGVLGRRGLRPPARPPGPSSLGPALAFGCLLAIQFSGSSRWAGRAGTDPVLVG